MINKLHFDTCIDVKIHREVFLSRGVILSAHSATDGRMDRWIYRVVKKKVFHKSKEKMHKKLKMALQRAKNLVHVKQHYGVSYYEEIFFLH